MDGQIKVINNSYVITRDEAVIHEINLHNVDRLLFIGDSYTEGMYYQKGKAWVCQLSEQLDYTCESYGWGGNTYPNLTQRLINNESRYNAIGVRDLKATRAVLMSFANDMATGGQLSNVYVENLRKCIQAVRNMGTEPIITTCWRNIWNVGVQLGLSGLANEERLQFWNPLAITSFLGTTTGSENSAYLWCFAGSHPAQRTGGIVFNNYLKYAKNLPRPTSAIKIYRLKNNITVSDINTDLSYSTRREKLLKFKEINISHSSLSNETDWDKLNNMTGISVNAVYSEYGKLMNGDVVSFGDYALVECVLPTLNGHVYKAILGLSDDTVEVYIKSYNGYVKLDSKEINKDTINSCMEYDKITFLLKKIGGFTLNDICLQWTGQEVAKSIPKQIPISIKGIEKLTTNIFTTLSHVTVIGTLIPTDVTNYTVMPTGCTKVITVDNSNYFKIVVNKSVTPIGTINNARVRIVARYNPEISSNLINENSYDRKLLEIKIKGQNTISNPQSLFNLTHEVDMAWTMCEFDIELNENTEITVMSGDTTPIEVCYMSILEV